MSALWSLVGSVFHDLIEAENRYEAHFPCELTQIEELEILDWLLRVAAPLALDECALKLRRRNPESARTLEGHAKSLRALHPCTSSKDTDHAHRTVLEAHESIAYEQRYYWSSGERGRVVDQATGEWEEAGTSQLMLLADLLRQGPEGAFGGSTAKEVESLFFAARGFLIRYATRNARLDEAHAKAQEVLGNALAALEQDASERLTVLRALRA